MLALLRGQLLKRPRQVPADQQLGHERVGRAHPELGRRQAVAVRKGQQQQQDGAKLLVDGLVLVLVLVVLPPVEQLAERVQDRVGLLEEQHDVERQRLLG